MPQSYYIYSILRIFERAVYMCRTRLTCNQSLKSKNKSSSSFSSSSSSSSWKAQTYAPPLPVARRKEEGVQFTPSDGSTGGALFRPMNGTMERCVNRSNFSSSSSSPEDDDCFQEPGDIRYDVLVMYHTLPVIIATGTFGNLMSIAVLLRRTMRNTSVYFYLVVLACADTVVLYASAAKTWLRLATDFEILHVSALACKSLIFILLISMFLSAWLVVLVTVDRFVAVWFPFRAGRGLCQPSCARAATGVLLLVAIAVNGHVFATIDLRQYDYMDRPFCGPDVLSTFMFGPFEYFKLIAYSLTPFVIILSLNAAIIARLKRRTLPVLDSSQHIVKSSPSSGGSNAAVNQANRVTSMLLAVSFTWLILTFPFTFYGLTHVSSSHQNMTAKAICFLLMYTNHAVNFYLYCLTGKRFRQELVRFVRAVVCCGGGARKKECPGVVSTGDGKSTRVRRTTKTIELEMMPSTGEYRFL